MSSPSATKYPLYEIAWVQDGARVQSHVQIPASAIPTLDGLVNDIHASQFGMSDIRGFSFIQLQPESTASSASELVQTILSEVCAEDDENQEVIAAAKRLDELTDRHPDAVRPCAVEFVWDNGGSDDNLFTDHFCSIPGSPEEAAFLECMNDLELNDGYFYDFVSFDPLLPRDGLLSLDDMVSLAQKEGEAASALVVFLNAAQSVDRRDRLLDAARQPIGPNRPSPSLKM